MIKIMYFWWKTGQSDAAIPTKWHEDSPGMWHIKKGFASAKKVYLLCFSLSEHFVFVKKLHPHCLFWAVNESLLRSLTATSARWLNSETAACLMQHVKSTREWFEIWSVLITCQEVGKKRRVAEKVVHTTSAAACCLNTHPPSPSWTN